jgi:hypothetical protein
MSKRLSKLSRVVDKLLEKTTIDEKVMDKLHEILDKTEIDDKIVQEYKDAVESGLIDKIKCYVKCYGGYALAVGAGCLFGVSFWWGLGFLVAAGIWAYMTRKATCKI